MKNTYLGRAVIKYDENGFMTNADFTPHLLLKVDEDLASKIGEQVKDVTDTATIQLNAEMVLASWFSSITEIELADREEYSIATSNIKCENHANGMIKECIIDYHFVKRVTNQA